MNIYIYRQYVVGTRRIYTCLSSLDYSAYPSLKPPFQPSRPQAAIQSTCNYLRHLQLKSLSFLYRIRHLLLPSRTILLLARPSITISDTLQLNVDCEAVAVVVATFTNKRALYCIVLYLLPVLNPKSYDGARVLGRPLLRS